MIYKKSLRMFSLIITFIIMIGVCGCMNNKVPKFTVDEILNYMNDKYCEEFSYIEPVDNSQPTSSSLAVFLESSNYPGKKITAKCVLSQNSDEKRYSDNYLSYVYEDDTRELLESMSISIYPDAKVRYTLNGGAPSSSSDSSDDGKLSFEDYISSTKSSIEYMILLPPDHDTTKSKNESDKLCECFKKNNVVCSVSIVYAKDDSQFDNFDTNVWVNNHIESKLHGDIIIGNDFEIAFEEWR